MSRQVPASRSSWGAAFLAATLGLLVTALLGLLSLMGMLIKNAIVLIDPIGIEQESGKSTYQAIIDSGVSRVIPVVMAAATTILTLIIVPMFYASFFRAESPQG